MTVLSSLVRVHTWALNEKRQKLAGLEELAERMRADLEQLEADLASERRAAGESIEGTVAFPAFIAAALERRKRLRESLANLERAITAAREDVRAAYQELKAFETARDNAARRERGRLAHREQRALDELGVNRYRRERSTGTDPES